MSGTGARGVGERGIPRNATGTPGATGRQGSFRFARPLRVAPAPPRPAVVVELTPGQHRAAVLIGRTRQADNVAAGRRHLHGANEEDGPVLHALGAPGELAASLALNLSWSGMLDRGAPDVGGVIEVRATTWATGHLFVYPDDRDDAPFLLVTGTPPCMTLRGWLLGREAKQPVWKKRDRDGLPCYYVAQEDLHPYDRAVLRGFAK